MDKQNIIESIRKKFKKKKKKRGRMSDETKEKMSQSHKQRIIEIKTKEDFDVIKSIDNTSKDLISELSDYYGINK